MKKANLTLYYNDITYESLTAVLNYNISKNEIHTEVLVVDLAFDRSVGFVSESIADWAKLLDLKIVGNVEAIITSVNNLNYISTLPKLKKSQFETHAIKEIKESFYKIDYFYRQTIIERGDFGTFVYTYLISSHVYSYLGEIVKEMKLKGVAAPMTVYDLMFAYAKDRGFIEGLAIYFSTEAFYLCLIVNDTWIDGMYVKDLHLTEKAISLVNLFLTKHRSSLNLSFDESLVISSLVGGSELKDRIIKHFNIENILEVEQRLEHESKLKHLLKPYKRIRP